MKNIKYLLIVFFLLPFFANAQLTVQRTAQVAGSSNNTSGNYATVVTFGQTAVDNQFAAGNYTGSIGFLREMHTTNEIHFTGYPTQGELYIIVVQSVVFEQAGITLQVGDEVGIYDGSTLVGHGKFTGSYPLVANSYLADASLGIPGAVIGNEILFKVWRMEDDTEYDAVPTINAGGHFGNMPATNVSVLTVPSGIEFTYNLLGNKLYYISPAVITETTAIPTVFGGLSPDYMQGNGQLYWPTAGLTTMNFVHTAGYKYFHSSNAVFTLSGGALTGGITVAVPAQSIAFIPYPYSSGHTFQDVFGAYSQITYLSDNVGVYIPLYGVNTIVPKPGVAYRTYASSGFNLVYPILSNSKNSEEIVDQQYVEGNAPFNKSGELYVVVFENTGNLEQGDEVLAYSNGECCGSVIYYGQNPFYIQTYVGNNEMGNTGASNNSPIELFVKRQNTNSLVELNVNFKQGGLYGVDLYSVAEIVNATEVAANFSQQCSMLAYPNPFSSQVTISFNVPVYKNNIRLQITDISGRIILNTGNFSKGENKFIWNTTEIKAGYYFCILFVDEVPVLTQKLVLTK